jgi:hypothetical protein
MHLGTGSHCAGPELPHCEDDQQACPFNLLWSSPDLHALELGFEVVIRLRCNRLIVWRLKAKVNSLSSRWNSYIYNKRKQSAIQVFLGVLLPCCIAPLSSNPVSFWSSTRVMFEHCTLGQNSDGCFSSKISICFEFSMFLPAELRCQSC